METMKKIIEETCGTEEEERIFRAVIRQHGNWSDFFRYPESCRDASAGVSGFIYYTDTVKFAKRHFQDIMNIVLDLEQEIGAPLEALREADEDTGRYNWLAWFALETVADKVMTWKDNR